MDFQIDPLIVVMRMKLDAVASEAAGYQTLNGLIGGLAG
jgi:hypothetical protein